MKYQFIPFCTIIFLMLIMACSERELIPDQFLDLPDMAFSVNNDSCIAPCTVVFSSSANETDTVSWNLGDGTIKIGKEVTHLYEVAGDFTVKLVVKNIHGVSNDTSFNLSILPADSSSVVTASFNKLSSSNGGVAPDSFCFLNTSINATSYQWDFGDGQTSNSLEDTVCHIFNDPGKYEVQLIAFSGDLTDTSNLEVVIHETQPLPIASFEVNNHSCAAPCLIEIINTSEHATSFYWDFGNGDTAITTSTEVIEVTYTNPGEYNIQLIALSEDFADTSSLAVIILENMPLPIASFEVNNDSCTAPCLVEFTNTSEYATSFYWDFGQGDTLSTNTLSTQFEYQNPGKYTVQLIAFSEVGADTVSADIDILVPLPIADFEVQNDSCVSPCSLEFINNSQHAESVLWNMGDGVIREEKNIGHAYEKPGAYRVILHVSNPWGQDSTSKTVTILSGNDPCNGADLWSMSAIDNVLATPGTVFFTNFIDRPGISFSWNFGDGTTSDEPNPRHIYAAVSETQDVEITLTIDDGIRQCTDTKKLRLFNGPVPGETKFTYINDIGQIVHASTTDDGPGSRLVSINNLQDLGTILDIAMDYRGRKLYILTGIGTTPLHGGVSPNIWECNPNGTDLRFVYGGLPPLEGPQAFNGRLLNIEFDEVRNSVLFIEKNEWVENQFILREYSKEDESVNNILFFEEQNRYAINHFVVNEQPWELYYHITNFIPSIKKFNLPPSTPTTTATVLKERDAGNFLFGMALDSDNNELYVYHGRDASIDVFDSVSGDLIRKMRINGNLIKRISLDLEHNQVFFTEEGTNKIGIKKSDPAGNNITTVVGQGVNPNTLQIGKF